MVAKLRSCCRIAAPVGGSAAWPTSEELARMATARAVQNGTFQRVSRRTTENVIGGSHDSTPYDGRCEAPCPPRAPHDVGARGRPRDAQRPRVADEAADGGAMRAADFLLNVDVAERPLRGRWHVTEEKGLRSATSTCCCTPPPSSDWRCARRRGARFTRAGGISSRSEDH